MARKTDPTKAPAQRTKKCTAKVRAGSKQQPCGTQYTGNLCPNRDNHLLKMKTGFCFNGWCEGTKAKDWRGNPVPTCQYIETCPCSCHDKLSKLFEMTDTERIVVESSGYTPPHRTYWMPSDDPLSPLSTSNRPDAPVLLESPAPDVVPPTIARPFSITPTGRAARGQLELWVKIECDAWLVDDPGELCTPSYLATQIARAQAIDPPSVGAISAVFDRWAKLGFALIGKKPTRFVGYTPDGVKLGLERMKEQAKRQTRLRIADDKRQLRR